MLSRRQTWASSHRPSQVSIFSEPVLFCVCSVVRPRCEAASSRQLIAATRHINKQEERDQDSRTAGQQGSRHIIPAAGVSGYKCRHNNRAQEPGRCQDCQEGVLVLVTMTVKLFADLMSQPARAVAIFCRAANIQVRCYLVDIVRQTERCGSTSW